MRRIACAAPLLCAWLLPGIAGAQRAPAPAAEYDAIMLGKKELKGDFASAFVKAPASVVPPQEVTLDVWTETGGSSDTAKCKIKIGRNRIVPAKEGQEGVEACPIVWSAPAPPDKLTFVFPANAKWKRGAQIVLAHRVRAGKGPELQAAEKNQLLLVKSKVPSDRGAGIVFVDTDSQGKVSWLFREVADGSVSIPVGLTGRSSLKGYASFDAAGAPAYVDIGVDLSASPPAQPQKPEPQPAPSAQGKALHMGFCNKGGRDDDKLYLVCVDLVTEGDQPRFQFKPDTRQILRPNRAVLVKVRHRRETTVDITMEGERGLYMPGVRVDVAPPGKPQGQAGAEESIDVVSEATFGPRRPGQADIKVKTTDGRLNPTYTVELLIEEAYLGAIRLGLGPVFKSAVDRAYEARTTPGSQQAEIVATSSGNVDLELVLGFAPFVFDYLTDGGRAAVTGCSLCIAPYVGIGLLNQRGTSLELMKSLHLGLEWEMSPSFSVAGTMVLRRVTRLAPGYEVGSPVDGEVPTTAAIGVGGGLVFSFSPELFKIATRQSQSFFK